MVKLSRITRTSLTLFAAFLLLFNDEPGFRFAARAGAAPSWSAPYLEGLLDIGLASKEAAVNQSAIIYYIYSLRNAPPRAGYRGRLNQDERRI